VQRVLGPDGTTSPSGYLYLSTSTYDTCNFTLLFAAFGEAALEPGELEVQPAVQWASLQKELIAYEYASNTSIPLTLDLSWSATGEASRSNTQHATRTPYGRFSAHYSSVSRDAQVTGSISTGTTNLIAQPLYSWAEIFHSSSGSMSRN
jgi:hypothetical protein